MRTGKFIAIASIFGGSRDAAGNIIDRDPHGYPTVWLSVTAGKIPNRQVLAGSVALRAGIKLDSDGIIGRGQDKGHVSSTRVIFGQWLHQGDHELYGPQYVFNVIQDLTESTPKDIMEAEAFLGEPEVFTVPRPELPADYQRKTERHVGRNRLDDNMHGTANQTNSRPAEIAREQLGIKSIDTSAPKNPEVELHGDVDQQGNPVQHRPAKS
jgi:hypothetical protein